MTLIRAAADRARYFAHAYARGMPVRNDECPKPTHTVAKVQGEIARERGIERRLLHLIKTRVSQINGCAYCIDMHTKDARAEGETEQ